VDRTPEAIVIGLQSAKGLSLSRRQFEALCDDVRRAPDSEERGRQLAAMPNREILELVGERRF